MAVTLQVNKAMTMRLGGMESDDDIYRGYYMTVWRYKISLQVLKNISQVSAMNEGNIF